MSREKEIDDRLLAAVAECRRQRLNERDRAGSRNRIANVGRCQEGFLELQGSFTAEELRALANALDGAEDAVRAMITDLQEESTAYQRGVQAGIQQMLASVKEYYARRPNQGMWTNAVEVLCALENHAQSK